MSRFAFRVPTKGGRSRENYKMVGSYDKPHSKVEILNFASKETAIKRARKLYDGTFVYLGEVNENNQILKEKNKEENNE